MLVELSVVEQRYQAVLAAIRDGVPVVEVAHRFDVSRQAIHRWLRWYEDQGLPGLADRSHRPLRCSHQMDPAIEVRVLEARRRNPDWGPRRLVHEASREGVDPVPSRSGVYRALKRAGLIDPQARRRRDRRFKRWERGGAMDGVGESRWLRLAPGMKPKRLSAQGGIRVSTRRVRVDEPGTRNAPSTQHGEVAMYAEDPAEGIASNPQERLTKEVRRRKFDIR
jgi:transposase